ncbi:hypothetical protein, partial [Escherichia coli]|uniref:hypothetical protein n=1 Tax=Escherichia coli TaxID=562 RepID=UPI0024AE7CC3
RKIAACFSSSVGSVISPCNSLYHDASATKIRIQLTIIYAILILPLRIELLSLSKWKSKKSPERITDFHSIKTDMPLSIQVCNIRQR